MKVDKEKFQALTEKDQNLQLFKVKHYNNKDENIHK